MKLWSKDILIFYFLALASWYGSMTFVFFCLLSAVSTYAVMSWANFLLMISYCLLAFLALSFG